MLATAETHLPFARSMIYLFAFDTRLRSVRAHFKSWKSSCRFYTAVIREPCATMNRRIKLHGEMRVPIIDFMVHLLWIATFPVLRQWQTGCADKPHRSLYTSVTSPSSKSNTKTNWLGVCKNNNCTIHDHNSVKYISFVLQKKEKMTRSGSQENDRTHIKDMSLPKIEPQQQRQGSHDHMDSKWKAVEWPSRSLEYMVNYISVKLCKHYSGLFFIILSSNPSSVHVFSYSDTNIDMIENGKKTKNIDR